MRSVADRIRRTLSPKQHKCQEASPASSVSHLTPFEFKVLGHFQFDTLHVSKDALSRQVYDPYTHIGYAAEISLYYG